DKLLRASWPFVPLPSEETDMARALWSGAIAFGLVNIPVKLYGATETKDLSFTTLHATCMTALKRPYICPNDYVPVDSKAEVKGYQDEVKLPPEPPATRPVVISDAEIDLALQLIKTLVTEFDPSKFRDRYRDALMALIQAKVEGKELPSVTKVETKPTQDLMAALK